MTRRLCGVAVLALVAGAACSNGGNTAALEERIAELEQRLADSTSTTVAPTTTAGPLGQWGAVNGTAECESTVDFDAGIDEGNRTVYDLHVLCTVTASDARVSGQEEGSGTYVMFGDANVAQWTCEEMTLTSEGGTWRGSCWGTDTWDEQDNLWTSGLATYQGEGAYEGLVYREFIAQWPGSGGYVYVGWLEPSA